MKTALSILSVLVFAVAAALTEAVNGSNGDAVADVVEAADVPAVEEGLSQEPVAVE